MKFLFCFKSSNRNWLATRTICSAINKWRNQSLHCHQSINRKITCSLNCDPAYATLQQCVDCAVGAAIIECHSTSFECFHDPNSYRFDLWVGKNGFLLHRMTHFIYTKFGGCRENVLSGRSCFIIAQCNLHAFHRAAVTKRSRDLAFHSPHSCYQWNSRDSWKKFAMYGVANRKFHVRRECNRGHTTRECYSITGRSCWCNRMTCWVKSGGVFHLQRHEYYHGTNDCNTKRVHTKLFYFCSNLHVDLTKNKKKESKLRFAINGYPVTKWYLAVFCCDFVH